LHDQITKLNLAVLRLEYRLKQKAPPPKTEDIKEANQLYLEARKAINDLDTPLGSLTSAGLVSEAKNKFHRILREYPNSDKAEASAFHLGSLYFNDNRQSDGAIEVYKKCLQLNPDTAFDVRFKLGLIYEAKADLDQARHWFERAAIEGGKAESKLAKDKLDSGEK
jgi:tetratricopeptide (TPR) repeat protein